MGGIFVWLAYSQQLRGHGYTGFRSPLAHYALC